MGAYDEMYRGWFWYRRSKSCNGIQGAITVLRQNIGYRYAANPKHTYLFATTAVYANTVSDVSMTYMGFP